jgi:signal transduction histidine kinase
MWGLSGRPIASYILVTLAAVVLIEVLVLGFQVPPLVYGAQLEARLQSQVDATAKSYAQELPRRYPHGVPPGTVLGEPGPPEQPGQDPAGPDGSTLAVPAITGTVAQSDQAFNAVVAVAADGTVAASSAPSRYPPGRAAARVAWPTGLTSSGKASASASGAIAYVYVQAPWSPPTFINPFTTWSELRQLGSALAAEQQRAAGDARDAERARIAREIHDAISQHLFDLRMIAAGMHRADPGNKQVRVIERISEEALRDMQALLIELRPTSLDRAGLPPALQEVCAAYRDRLGVAVEASLEDITVPAPVEHALLRITQEACVNAVRHGGARRLAVSLARQDGHVELSVRDDGSGFDPVASPAGAGLSHIRDRVAELGGTVNIASSPGCGAALTVRVPVS